MIDVKQTGLPISGAHWSYGPDYMRQVSKASARALCGMYPLPPMGSETVVAVTPGRLNLCVQNISGAFFLASCDAPVKSWPDVFGVRIVGGQ